MATGFSLPSDRMTTTAETTAPVDGDRPLDYELLLRRCMGRIDLVERLLKSFDDRLPKELAQIDECLAAGDGERLARLAHQLKGTTANISASAMLAIAAEMEEAARAKQFDKVVAGLAEIRQAWEQFKDYKASLPRVEGATSVRPGVGK
jgi:HPt (histidine-containing phosphotransfer) domain-containing protein